jgi:hypothetical protein
MTQQQQENQTQIEKFLYYLKEGWFILLFIGTIVVGWTNITNEIKYQDIRIKSLENRSKAVDDTLSQIASDLSFIRGKLEKQ